VRNFILKLLYVTAYHMGVFRMLFYIQKKRQTIVTYHNVISDDLFDSDVARWPGEHVTTVRTAAALDKASLLEGVQYLHDERLRHMLPGSRRAGGDRNTLRLLGQVDQEPQAVVHLYWK